MFRKVLSHPIFSGSLLMIGGTMLANIVNYFYQLTMGRTLGIVSYGELSSIFAIFYIVTIVPISASPSIIKFISTAKNHNEVGFIYQKINLIILKTALALAIIVLLLSPLISSFLHIGILEVTLVAPVIFFSLITVTNQALLQGVLRFWGNVGPNFLGSVSKLIFGIIFVIIGWKVFGAVLGVLFGAVLGYLYSLYLAKQFLKKLKPKGKFDLKKFLKFSFPVLIFSFSFTSFFTLDLILVKHFFTDIQAGIYATLSILGKIIYFAAAPIASVMFPHVAGRHARGENYFQLLLVSLLVTIFVALGIVSVYALFPDIIIGVFAKGNKIIPVEDLIWMGLFICFYTISYFLMNFFISIDKVKIVIVPLMFAVLQFILILFFHNSILQVIQISLFVMIILFIILFSYLVYNRISYAKR